MSPGSIAATQHGNRGGGWAPAPTAGDTPAKPKDPEDRYCRICLDLDHPVNVKIADHPKKLCRACGGYLCHHQGDDEQLCWEGRARMARARVCAGGELNGVEVEALARHPNPPMLTVNGYTLDTERSTEAGHWKKATG